MLEVHSPWTKERKWEKYYATVIRRPCISTYVNSASNSSQAHDITLPRHSIPTTWRKSPWQHRHMCNAYYAGSVIDYLAWESFPFNSTVEEQPRTRTEFGRRSFHVAAPAVWNALPTHLRSTTIFRGQFRAGLKTYLFNLAFYTDSLWELLLKSVLTYLLTYVRRNGLQSVLGQDNRPPVICSSKSPNS